MHLREKILSVFKARNPFKSPPALAAAGALLFLALNAPGHAQTGAAAQSTVVSIDNEPAPRLVVEHPLPGPLANNVVFIPYRLEYLRILPVGGPAARNMSPRVGHLHITLDDLPWQWADYGQSNTVILVGLPRGPHKVLIEVVDPEGRVFTSQSVTFTTPGPAPQSR